MDTLLSVHNLKVWLQTDTGYVKAVDTVNLLIRQGRTLGLVGESGCGKSLFALSLLRLLPINAKVDVRAQVILDNQDLYGISEKSMQSIRQKKIGMIFQDPTLSLNPVLSIGQQLYESGVTRAKAQDLLKEVRVPDPTRILKMYPHQLSGGMKQRIVIAMALAKEPLLLIADEPTTALDTTIQAQILQLLRALQTRYGMAMLFISHNLGVVRQIAQDIAVMYAGELVEQQPVDSFFKQPLHPYCQQLLSAIPETNHPDQPLRTIVGQVPSLLQKWNGCRFQSRCYAKWSLCETVTPELISVQAETAVRCHWHDVRQCKPIASLSMPDMPNLLEPKEALEDIPAPALLTVTDLKVHFPIRKGVLKRTIGHVKAVDGVSFILYPDETIAIVGESGCGKSTLAKALLQLIQPTSGSIQYQDADLTQLSHRALRKQRGDFQLIFQDPYASLDPRMRIEDSLLEGMQALRVGTNHGECRERLQVLMEQVGLPVSWLSRYPHELSGGQRQRLCIARALAVGPKWLVCDEPTSALDVSVQAQILNLLVDLQSEYQMSYLLITHDFGVVNYMADKVMVMYLGKIVEYGTREAILQSPKHPYTQALLKAVPSIKHRQEISPPIGETPSPASPPTGCHYHLRCPHAMPICKTVYPILTSQPDRMIACHLIEQVDT